MNGISNDPSLRAPGSSSHPLRMAETESERRAAFGKRIVLARRRMKWSAAKLARALEVTPQRLNHWETGQYVPQELVHYQAIADVLGVTLDWLFLGRAVGLSADVHSMLEDVKQEATKKTPGRPRKIVKND